MLRTLFYSLLTSVTMLGSWLDGSLEAPALPQPEVPKPRAIPEKPKPPGFGFYKAMDTTKKDTTDTIPPYNRDRYGNPYSAFRSKSPLLLGMPSNYEFKIDIDTTGAFYNMEETLGDVYFRTPSRMTFDQYRELRYREQIRDYWRESLSQELQDAKKDSAGDASSTSLVPPLPTLPPAAARLFGGDSITIKPNGNLMLDFGGRWQRIDNPAIPVRQQRNGGFEFDQQIQMALTGQVGTNLKLNANFDTKSSFQFEQLYNMTYNAQEEDIVQEVQLGNLSFQSSNSLITGSQNLFGVSTRMRFGKLWVRSVASNQRGSIETLTIRNGAQGREFEILASEYEVNRHFFLGHFFRENYERGLASLPLINTGINITRIEVYVTNRNNDTETQRNVTATMDLGEADAFRQNLPFVGGSGANVPNDNSANSLYNNLRAITRDPDAISGSLESQGLSRGTDFELLQRARKLKPEEFEFHQQLGYLTLYTPIRNDEVLAVAYEYTFNGVPYKVGELTEDYQNLGDNDVIQLKLLSPSTINTSVPSWDLMMKNIYSLNATRIQQEGFQLRVIYRDDLTGQDNPSLHEGANTKDVPLVQLLNLDRLNPNNDPQIDGNFDYLVGITIDEQNGRVIFPIVEPFGDHLRSKFNEGELEFIDKYVFDELYDGTQADAQLNTTKNKFLLKGTYQSGTGQDILLNAFNIAEGSVVVRAGNTQLSEGSDYTVDYQSGRVRILNEGIMASGKEIKIQYERADPFNFQVRTLAGVDAEYHVNKNLRLTGTALYYNERPAISRVNIGREPVRNTLWGTGVDYRTKSRLLTKVVNAIPFVKTKTESDVSIKAEFAQILPGVPRGLLDKDGRSYIDDFEGAEVPYDFTRSPLSWAIGSTPQRILNQNNSASPLSSGFKRARLAWYNIDNIFYFNSGLFTRPEHLTDEDMENHYVRSIRFNEVFPNKQADQFNLPEVSFDLAFYPEERGPYNYNPDLQPDGSLKNPRENYGAITRAITSDIDFDNINIQYIEFWLMDPFISTDNGTISGENNTTGGKMFINLGNISEDVIPDGKHFFENGLPSSDESPWGIVPTEPFLTNAFDADNGIRAVQDVGFDGLSDQEEAEKFADFLDQAAANGVDISAIQADPSADNFSYYLGNNQDGQELSVLERYKQFNNVDDNSPVGTENYNGTQITASNTNQPDNEDLNRDNTLSALDQYYEYELDIRPGLTLDHPYIVDQVTAQADGAGEQVNWYQFRIPIRDQSATNINGINGFKSIRYMRLYMTDWQQPVVMRMVKFQLVGAQWRPFLEAFNEGGLSEPLEPGNLDFNVSSVNVEENGTSTEDNEVPYVVPPGMTRDFDVTSQVPRRTNEQSLQVCVDDLPDNQSRAVYKNLAIDMVQYGRVKMYIHASSPNNSTPDDKLSAFLRLGTDFQQNFYEIEVPLKMTRVPASSAQEIWPEENFLDVALEELYQAKVKRNRDGANKQIPYTVEIEGTPYKVKVVGNPDLSAVKTAMLGVRNPQDDGQSFSTCVWFNELQVTDFNKQAGWATNVQIGANLADFATINTTMQYSTVGFGAIQDKLIDRQRSDNLDFDISSNINLDKILLNKIGIKLPLFVSYERHTKNPFFNPLDPDVPLSAAVNAFETEEEKQEYRDKVQDITVRRSINFTNVRKVKLKKDAKKHIWDIENFAFSAAYSDEFRRDNSIDEYAAKRWNIGGNWNYAFGNKPFEPFKNSKSPFFKTAYGKPFKDINFNPLPRTIAITGKLDRSYIKTQLRNGDLETDGILPTFEKSYFFNRTYAANWNLTKGITATYNSTANAIIDEPAGAISDDFANDSIQANLLKLGRMKLFRQTVSGNYTLPLDKFPITDWLSSSARYAADYTWQAGAVGLADTLGHTIRNSRNLTLNGKIDFKKIYNKNAYLKSLGKSTRARPGSKPKASFDPLEHRKKKLIDKEKELEKKMNKRNYRKTKKYQRKQPKREERYAEPGEPLPSPISLTKRDIGKLGKKKVKLDEKLEKIEAKKKERGDPKLLSGLEILANALTSVKDISVNATQNGTTLLPGFMPTPLYFGLDENQQAPGIPFLLGSQDPTIRFDAARNGWLAANENQNLPFQQTQTQTITIQSRVEPTKNIDIQLRASRSRSNNYTEVFRYLPGEDDFEIQAPVRSGNYGISFFSLPTAFEGDNALHDSEAFDAFARNRDIIRGRYGNELDTNAQDVLVPAFIAAYTGQSANGVGLTSFPGIPIPNWTLNITGLEKLAIFEEKVRSITIRHGYKSEYSIGSFTSSLFYSDPELGYDLSLRRNERFFNNPIANDSGQVVPVLVVGEVRIQESFSPLIGINIRMKKHFSFKFDVNKTRNVGLTLSNGQVTEQRNTGVTIDIGYDKTKMRLPAFLVFRRSSIVLPNEVQFRCAFSLRNSKTFQRSFENGSTITNGNINIQFRPTITYKINNAANLQMYFERQINQPFVSNSFRRTSTAFGVQFRYNLTQGNLGSR